MKLHSETVKNHDFLAHAVSSILNIMQTFWGHIRFQSIQLTLTQSWPLLIEMIYLSMKDSSYVIIFKI